MCPKAYEIGMSDGVEEFITIGIVSRGYVFNEPPMHFLNENNVPVMISVQNKLCVEYAFLNVYADELQCMGLWWLPRHTIHNRINTVLDFISVYPDGWKRLIFL